MTEEPRKRRFLHLPSPAMGVAMIALAVALGGTATAGGLLLTGAALEGTALAVHYFYYTKYTPESENPPLTAGDPVFTKRLNDMVPFAGVRAFYLQDTASNVIAGRAFLCAGETIGLATYGPRIPSDRILDGAMANLSAALE